jgi:hypothetical protein
MADPSTRATRDLNVAILEFTQAFLEADGPCSARGLDCRFSGRDPWRDIGMKDAKPC